MKTDPCRHCHGVGRITFRHPTRAEIMSHDCTSCNGTGIDGDPRFLLAFMLVAMLVTVVVLFVVLPL